MPIYVMTYFVCLFSDFGCDFDVDFYAHFHTCLCPCHASVYLLSSSDVSPVSPAPRLHSNPFHAPLAIHSSASRPPSAVSRPSSWPVEDHYPLPSSDSVLDDRRLRCPRHLCPPYLERSPGLGSCTMVAAYGYGAPLRRGSAC